VADTMRSEGHTTKVAARLAEGGPLVLESTASAPVPTFAAIAEEWPHKYPALHAIRPGIPDGYRSLRHGISFRLSAICQSQM